MKICNIQLPSINYEAPNHVPSITQCHGILNFFNIDMVDINMFLLRSKFYTFIKENENKILSSDIIIVDIIFNITPLKIEIIKYLKENYKEKIFVAFLFLSDSCISIIDKYFDVIFKFPLEHSFYTWCKKNFPITTKIIEPETNKEIFNKILPCYDLFDDFKFYVFMGWLEEKMCITYYSTGCNNRCHFCTEYYPRIKKDKEKFIKELRSYKYEKIHFTDSSLNQTPNDFKDFISMMYNENKKYVGYIQCEEFDEKTLDDLSKSGCMALFIGIESLCNSYLKKIGKHRRDIDVIKMLDGLTSRGIKVYIPFIVAGLEYQTEEEFLYDYNYIEDLFPYVHQIDIHRLDFHPGTRLTETKKTEIRYNYDIAKERKNLMIEKVRKANKSSQEFDI